MIAENQSNNGFFAELPQIEYNAIVVYNPSTREGIIASSGDLPYSIGDSKVMRICGKKYPRTSFYLFRETSQKQITEEARINGFRVMRVFNESCPFSQLISNPQKRSADGKELANLVEGFFKATDL